MIFVTQHYSTHQAKLHDKEDIVKHQVTDLLFYIGKVAERLCFIEAAAGTSGNISVKINNLRIEQFPEEGVRETTYHNLDNEFSELYKQRFLITGSGKNFRHIRERPHECLAVIEIVRGGYNILWGLQKDEVITSEHPAHFATYQRRAQISAVIHAHPTSINVITRLFRREDSLNRLLGEQHEQIKIYSPNGIGLVDRGKHGSYKLGHSVASSLSDRDICAVIRHGTFSVGENSPLKALNQACDLIEYYHDAARTFIDNPWFKMLPMDLLMKNLEGVSRLPLGDRMVDKFLGNPK